MVREHFLTTADERAWRSHLSEGRSVFGSIGYARICERFRGYVPRLYVLESGDSTICYPLLLRSLRNLPFRETTVGEWDSATPDFTGPLMSGNNCQLAALFPGARDALFLQEKVVAEFAHLHPWNGASSKLMEGCLYDRDIVWVDVALSPEKLWRDHFEYSCQKNIKRAEREGVRVHVASGDDDVREFLRLYHATMDRNQALTNYYFSYEFFSTFREELPDNSRFVLAEYCGQVVAATLYLFDDTDVFSFLGGADAAFQIVRPTNAIIWDTIRWAHSAGKKRLILGGGYGRNDGIFRFKSTFSPLRQPFHIYKRIHLERDYAALERRCRDYAGLNSEPIGYFPSYRFLPTEVSAAQDE